MDIFKAYESTMANVQPGSRIKHLRRDQLLDNYEAAASTLQTLIRAKETEIAHRKDLMKMLEETKSFHDNRLQESKQEYQTAKSNLPESIDLKSINVKFELSTTPPLPQSALKHALPPPISTTPPLPPGPAPSFIAPSTVPTTTKTSEFDIPLPNDNYHNRSSLDRRLSEFMKTFPNLTQAGVASANNTEPPKPQAPGYYTPQASLPPLSTAPPSIDMFRFPPPNMVPPPHGLIVQPPPPMIQPPPVNQHQENYDPADMDMSDNEDGGVLPMIASAMQQGAGGRTAQSFVGSHQQQFNSNPMPYTPRLNALPFDPSIMDPTLGGSPSSSGSRDRYSGDENNHRYSGGSGCSSSGKHRSSSGSKKYSSSSSSASSHSSNRGKTRH